MRPSSLRGSRCRFPQSVLAVHSVAGRSYVLAAVAALVPTAVSAHGGGGPGIVQFNPLIWLGLILIGAAYFYATGIIEQRDPEAVSPRQLWFFLGGICRHLRRPAIADRHLRGQRLLGAYDPASAAHPRRAAAAAARHALRLHRAARAARAARGDARARNPGARGSSPPARSSSGISHPSTTRR